MNSRRSLMLARRVVQQLMADRRTVALILIVPLVVLTVASVLLRADTTSLNLAVIMLDKGASLPLNMGQVNLGERLSENLGTISQNVHLQTLDAATAQSALEQGQLDAILTFPPDFSTQVVQTRALNLAVLYEGSNPMAAQVMQGLLIRAAIETLASVSAIAPVGVQSMPEVHIEASYRYGSAEFDSLDYIAPVFIGMFVFLFVFILTSVAFLRERSSGTLERLHATPIRRSEIVVGYMFGFAGFALAQSLIILFFTIFGLRVHYVGSLMVVFVVEMLLAFMAVNLGIFFSTFARNEFQVVQFIPLVVVTQILLSGAFWAVEDMPGWLQPLAWLMPLTYANRALRDVMIKGSDLLQVGPFIVMLAGFAVAFIVLASQTIQRQAGAR